MTLYDRALLTLPVTLIGLTLGLALLCGVAVTVPARAQSGNHGDGHAANHDWYRTLKTKSGWS